METLIQFKTEKIAKEKGFNVPCANGYYETLAHTLDCGRGGEIDFPYIPPRTLSQPAYGFKAENVFIAQAPSQQVLADWLLKEHGLFVNVDFAYNEWGRYSAGIYRKAKDGKTAILAMDGMTIFDNPKDAFEDGLFEALKLIP